MCEAPALFFLYSTFCFNLDFVSCHRKSLVGVDGSEGICLSFYQAALDVTIHPVKWFNEINKCRIWWTAIWEGPSDDPLACFNHTVSLMFLQRAALTHSSHHAASLRHELKLGSAVDTLFLRAPGGQKLWNVTSRSRFCACSHGFKMGGGGTKKHVHIEAKVGG